MAAKDRSSGVVLDDVSKAIIEQLQEDGRRPYAAIGKAVGLSEAAVRQRVQRLLDAGRHADRRGHRPAHRSGFHAPGDDRHHASRATSRPVADELADMAEVDYVVITAGSFDLLVEVVCEDDDHLLESVNKRIRALPGVRDHRDLRLPQAPQADLHLGNPMTMTPQRPSSRRDDRSRRSARATTSGCTSPACRRTRQRRVPIIVRGEGRTSGTPTGKRYLDGLAGLFVVQAGHGRAELAEAAAKQASELAFFPLWSYAHPQGDRAGRAARRPRARRPQPGLLHHRRRRGGRDRVEAGQAVLQAHRQADEAQGDQPRRSPTTAPRRARCRSPASRRSRRRSSRSCPARTRCRTPTSTARPSTATTSRRSAAGPPTRSSEAIEFEGPDTVAAVFLEPVQNSGGCFPPPPGYFQRVREICDQYDVLLVSDEVICAFGRLGHMFGCDRFGYLPDIITCAKGMTSRLLPDRRDDRHATGSSSRSCTATTTFPHGYTFGGHPVSAAVALANLDIFEREGLNEHVLRQRGRLPGHAGEAARPADRRRRPRRRLLLRHRAGQGQGHQGDLRRRRVRAAAARLPVQGAVRRRPLLPGRRPRRPGHPARAAADLRPAALRRDRADPARRCSPRPGPASDRSARDRRPHHGPAAAGEAGPRPRGARRGPRRRPGRARRGRRRRRPALRRPGRPTPATATRVLFHGSTGEPAVPRAGRRRADLPHGHAARRPGAGPVGCSSRRCTTACAMVLGTAARCSTATPSCAALRAGHRAPDARPLGRRAAAQPQGARRDPGPRRCRSTSGR